MHESTTSGMLKQRDANKLIDNVCDTLEIDFRRIRNVHGAFCRYVSRQTVKTQEQFEKDRERVMGVIGWVWKRGYTDDYKKLVMLLMEIENPKEER